MGEYDRYCLIIKTLLLRVCWKYVCVNGVIAMDEFLALGCMSR